MTVLVSFLTAVLVIAFVTLAYDLVAGAYGERLNTWWNQ